MSAYRPYPSYKDSGVEWLGDVPEGWALRRSKFLFKKRAEEPLVDDGIVTAFRDGQVTLRTNRRTEGFTNALQEIGYQRVHKGDLVVHAMDAFAGAIGVSDATGKCSPVCSVCTPWRPTECFTSYFGGLLRSMAISGFVESLAKGIRERSTDFRFADFKELWLPVPSLPEQHQIAAFLDRECGKLDALQTKQERLIELLKEKRQALISHAVTKGLDPTAKLKPSGIEWLGDVPEHWRVAGFTKFIISRVDYRGRTPEKTDSGVFLVTARNIKNGKIDYEAAREYITEESYQDIMLRGKPEIGDVLFTTEAPLGEVAEVDRTDVGLAQRIIKFRGHPRHLRNDFLKYFILSEAFQQGLYSYASGSTALGIKAERFIHLRQLLPTLAEQQAIVAHLEEKCGKIDQLKAKAERAIELLKERRSALISAAVTGKIDVRDS